mmetsp:Transcript_32031/g.75095  ORF Transcript_32031/g.75095 Transcript_32031/m.75095 type:complete len:452 (+) Transcript_32031:86-1441(+)
MFGADDVSRSGGLAALCLSARGPRRSQPLQQRACIGADQQLISPRSWQAPAAQPAATVAALAGTTSSATASSEAKCKELQRQVQQLSEELKLCEAAMTACSSLKSHFNDSEAMYMKEAKLRQAAEVSQKDAKAQAGLLKGEVKSLQTSVAELSRQLALASEAALEAQKRQAVIEASEREARRILHVREETFASELREMMDHAEASCLRQAQDECSRLRASVHVERRISRSFHEELIASQAEVSCMAAELKSLRAERPEPKAARAVRTFSPRPAQDRWNSDESAELAKLRSLCQQREIEVFGLHRRISQVSDERDRLAADLASIHKLFGGDVKALIASRQQGSLFAGKTHLTVPQPTAGVPRLNNMPLLRSYDEEVQCNGNISSRSWFERSTVNTCPDSDLAADVAELKQRYEDHEQEIAKLRAADSRREADIKEHVQGDMPVQPEEILKEA